MTTKEALKSRAERLLASLPEEALSEVVAHLESTYAQHGETGGGQATYRPIALGGLWQGVTLDDNDIAEVRKEMWAPFDDRSV
jgi:hypothetical protein